MHRPTGFATTAIPSLGAALRLGEAVREDAAAFCGPEPANFSDQRLPVPGSSCELARHGRSILPIWACASQARRNASAHFRCDYFGAS
jgi:hypothetical protein